METGQSRLHWTWALCWGKWSALLNAVCLYSVSESKLTKASLLSTSTSPSTRLCTPSFSRAAFLNLLLYQWTLWSVLCVESSTCILGAQLLTLPGPAVLCWLLISYRTRFFYDLIFYVEARWGLSFNISAQLSTELPFGVRI